MFEQDIPTTKKKGPRTPKKITKQRLKNVALYYLERYESSVENLRDVLKKRILKYKIAFPDFNPEEAYSWVEEVLQELQGYGYLDDKRYAEIKIDSYLSAGKPERYIKIKLQQKGISAELADSILREKEFSPFEMALKFAKKKKIGPFSASDEIRRENRQKDLGKLVRAGFDYDTAIQTLNFSK